MTASSELTNPAGVSVIVLAETKRLPVQFLQELGVRDVDGGVAIPYGEGNRLRIRTSLSASGSRWQLSKSPIVPYGLFRPEVAGGRKLDSVIVVEGESDAWTLWHHGYPALGIPGASMVKVLGADHISGLGRLFVVSEPDTAGVAFPFSIAARVAEMREQADEIGAAVALPEVFAVSMPGNLKDPSALHIAFDGDKGRFAVAIDQAVRASIPVSAGSADNADSAMEWAPPMPLHYFDPPPFPTHVLPHWWRVFVEAEAGATQTPPDLAAMLSLSAVAACSARRIEVEVKQGWREPLNIYTVTVLPSGNRKSAVFRDVVAPLEAEEERAALAAQNEVAIAKEEKDYLHRKLKKARKDIESGTATLEDTQRIAAEIARFQVPRNPRLLADDITAEKLEILLAEQNGRMAVLSPEADIFEIMAGRYSASGITNLGVFLKGHAGDSIRVDRVGRGTVTVHHPALTVGLAVQPDVIYGLAEKREFRGRGLTPRFLYSLPVSNVGRRDVDPPPLPKAIRSTFEANLTKLLELRSAENEDADYRPHVLHLDDEARRALLLFAAQIEVELSPTGELGDIVEWGSKLVGAVARVAGNLHIAENAAEDEPWKNPVTSDVIERAIEVGEYLIRHAHAAFALMGSDPAIANAEHILKWIEGKSKTEFTVRELFEGVKGRFKRVNNLKPGLLLLIDHQYIRKHEQPRRPGPGRPPSPVFDVNPAVHSQNPQNPQIRP